MAGETTIPTTHPPDAEASSTPATVATDPPSREVFDALDQDGRDDAIYSMLETGESDLDRWLSRGGEPGTAPAAGVPRPTQQQDRTEPDEPAPAADASSTTEPGLTRKEALAILQRDGFGRDALEAMSGTMSDDQLIATAAHRRKVQADVDRFGNEYRKLQSDHERLSGYIDGIRAGGNGAPPGIEDEPTGTGDAQVDRLRSLADEHVGPEFGSALAETLSESKAELRRLRTIRQEEQMRVARERVGTEFSELDPARGEDGSEAYGQVMQRMLQLASSVGVDGKHVYTTDDTERLMRDAAILEFGMDMRARAQQQITRDHATEADGQPDPPAAGRDQERELNADEKQDRVYELLMQGNEPTATRRQVYGG